MTQLRLPDGSIIVDLFAGGGGASTGIEQAIGRPVDVAINHDPDAVSMHAANHPHAEHYVADVFEVDPCAATRGRHVRHLHASPDCTHFSQAKGGQPRDRKIRALSWMVHRWAGHVRPDVITLENVEQILQWAPLVAKRCPHTGRVLKIDGTTAAAGERVPVEQQHLVPCPRRKGRNWQHFVDGLRAMGYAVQWRKLRACDYGAPTSRMRLFMVARCDGKPIRWPEPTHAQHPKRGQRPWRAAAECIDWSAPCPSIFDRPRPLAEATMRRIAKGVRRYVLEAAQPFILQCANASANGIAGAVHPLGVITAKPKGGSHAVVAPALVKFRGASAGSDAAAPMPTITSGAGARRPAGAPHAMGVLAAFLEQAHGGGEHGNPARARGADEPVSTISTSGSQQRLVTAHMAKLRGTSAAADVTDPLATVSAGGEHHAVIECTLSPEHEAGALRVAAFLMRYHGTGGQHAELGEPLTTVTTRDRLALVTVTIAGTPYVIVDIGLRMLQPRELYRAQGFPDWYVIDRGHDGRRFSKSAQMRMVGNSVSPAPMAALIAANLDDAQQAREEAA